MARKLMREILARKGFCKDMRNHFKQLIISREHFQIYPSPIRD